MHLILRDIFSVNRHKLSIVKFGQWGTIFIIYKNRVLIQLSLQGIPFLISKLDEKHDKRTVKLLIFLSSWQCWYVLRYHVHMRHTKPFFNISPRSIKENTTYYLIQMPRCFVWLQSKPIHPLWYNFSRQCSELILPLHYVGDRKWSCPSKS